MRNKKESKLDLSMNMHYGNAGEYFVLFDLSMKGYHCFLSNRGTPFDLIVYHNDKNYRIQVKSTMNPSSGKLKNVYGFFLRKSRVKNRRKLKPYCDILAFVCLSKKTIAYMNVEDAVGKDGFLKTSYIFRDKSELFVGRSYSNGTKRKALKNANYFQDYETLTLK